MELTRPQKVLVVAGLAGILVGILLLSRGRLAGSPTPAPVIYTAPQSGAGATRIAVHVTGAVRSPGLYWLPQGARAADAIQAAGGWTGDADAASVNLAAVVQDGSQVTVARLQPMSGDFTAAPAAGGPSTPTVPSPPLPASAGAAPPVSPPTPAAQPAPLLSLNQATLDQLQAVPGIGPELAKRILYFRYEHGGIRSVDELLQVEGIGPERLRRLQAYVRP